VPNRVVAYRKSFLDGGQRAPRTGPRGLIISMPVYYAGGDGTTLLDPDGGYAVFDV
jgi:hypothetical protein